MSQPPDDHTAKSQMDPWERRERERARWSQPTSAPRKSASQNEPPSEGGSYVAMGLLASICLLLLGDTPRISEVPRSLMIAAGSIIPLILFAFARFTVEDFRLTVRRGQNPWILALLAWGVFAFFTSPFRHASGFGVVGSDLVRVFSGAVLYLIAAYGLRTPREISSTVVGLISFACLVALAEFSDIGGSQKLTDWVRLDTVFGSHEGLGTLLMLVLPLPLAFLLSNETEEKRRLAALAATIILGLALLVSRTRSAWIGMTVALLLLVLFTYWARVKGRSQSAGGSKLRRSGGTIISFLTSPITLVVLALIGILIYTGVATLIKSRASVHTAIRSSSERLDLWNAGARMTWDRPLTGWGLGSFLIIQGRWSHIGNDVAAVITHGADENNNAHNYYIEWAADTGAPGLFLYVAVITASLIAGVRRLWDLRSRGNSARPGSEAIPSFQRTLLAGCTAAFAGGCVDAIASPAYTYHSLSGIFWLLMGLGVAAQRPASASSGAAFVKDRANGSSESALTTVLVQLAPPLAGTLAAALILFIGFRLTDIGKYRARGTFQIKVMRQRKGAVLAGERIIWRTVYRDEKGKIGNTYPGTTWEFSSSDPLALEQMKRSVAFARLKTANQYDSVLSVAAPSATDQPVMAHATFYDVYSRRYDAWSSVSVALSRSRPTTLPRSSRLPSPKSR